MIQLKELKVLLFEVWDPIGINSNRLLIDEYDNYAESLYACLIKKNMNKNEIIDSLSEFESDIGSVSTERQKSDVADRILFYQNQ